jgi:nucleoside-diphosphate-sugar epimerase
MNSNTSLPVNIGNPEEYTMMDFAKKVIEKVGRKDVSLVYQPMPKDDPARRRPDISRARKLIGYVHPLCQ